MALLELRNSIVCAALLVVVPINCSEPTSPGYKKGPPLGCPQDAAHNVSIIGQPCEAGSTCVGLAYDCDRVYQSPNTCECTNGSWTCTVPKLNCQRVCGGVLVDTATDGENCGTCGHDCLGTGCAGSRCQPVVLASGLDNPAGIAVDATNVYWTTAGHWEQNGPTRGEVMKCAITGCGGQPTVLASGSNEPWSVAVDGTRVYWTQNGWSSVVLECATGGCNGSPTQLASGALALGIAVDATNVYWTTATQAQQCSKSGCGGTPTTLGGTGQSNTLLGGITVDSTNVYWADQGPYGQAGGRVLKCAIGGCNGAPTVLASGQATPSAVAVDATNVYWTNNGNETQVMTCPIGGCGGAPTILAALLPDQVLSIQGIAADAANVYWTTYDLVLQCAKAGCGGAPANLAWDQPDVGSLVVDATAVYWTTGGYTADGRVDGRVMKVVK